MILAGAHKENEGSENANFAITDNETDKC